MKNNYENRNRTCLIRRCPVILRLDGKAFHSFTKTFEKPYSTLLKQCMEYATEVLCDEIQGAQLAYTQSDEISILITDYTNLETQAWFDYNVQKMTSIAASIATAAFNSKICEYINIHAYFDCRCFNIPKEEVINYFVWRFKDWERNSIQMLAQSLYSHKELHGKNCSDLQEMCFQKGHNWANLPPVWKNGTFYYKKDGVKYTVHDKRLPEDRAFFEQFVNIDEKNKND
ncbi:MAG: tRNA(His) guanylyltransferase Thg1 family protein [Candidatus Gracilibacteria bacterium]|nr:tRNA(His) guanylyltransferase Thg1 family protein [Candidatus Gracilibacteria bacterium]